MSAGPDLLAQVEEQPCPVTARAAADLPRRVAAVLPVLREHAATIDGAASFPQANLDALRKQGLLGLLVPSRYGGLGGNLADLVSVADQLAGACLSTAMIWAMHCQQVATVVGHAATTLRERLLPRIGAGEVYLASVTSERGKGGHVLSAQAPLRRVDGQLVLRREAPIVTGGQFADGFLITMRDRPEAPANAVSMVYADRSQLRLHCSGDWNPMGMRGTHSVAMTLEAALEPDQIVGAPGAFREVAVSTFAPVGHVAWTACWLG
ncbi:MAG TPA: acyl-CoA dehydrogenase family protein, partial [Micromonosporaceae bacterium]